MKIRACRFGKKKIVNILLEKGASVNEKNVFGSTPLHLACEYGDLDIVRVGISNFICLMIRKYIEYKKVGRLLRNNNLIAKSE